MHLSATNAKTPILVAIVDLTASPVLEDDQVMFIECENTSRGHFFGTSHNPVFTKWALLRIVIKSSNE